jgi:hypothetical protein
MMQIRNNIFYAKYISSKIKLITKALSLQSRVIEFNLSSAAMNPVI